MQQTHHGYILSTGKEIRSLSLDPTADYATIFDNHHGRWTHKTNFTQEEKEEIAQYAIKLWQEWAKS